MSGGDLEELEIPDSIFGDGETEGTEFVRFWICAGKDHVVLRIGSLQPPNAEPRQWGYIMADIARHAVRGMQQDDPSRGSPEQMFAEIEHGFRERFGQHLSFTGQIQVDKQ